MLDDRVRKLSRDAAAGDREAIQELDGLSLRTGGQVASGEDLLLFARCRAVLHARGLDLFDESGSAIGRVFTDQAVQVEEVSGGISLYDVRRGRRVLLGTQIGEHVLPGEVSASSAVREYVSRLAGVQATPRREDA